MKCRFNCEDDAFEYYLNTKEDIDMWEGDYDELVDSFILWAEKNKVSWNEY